MQNHVIRQLPTIGKKYHRIRVHDICYPIPRNVREKKRNQSPNLTKRLLQLSHRNSLGEILVFPEA